MKTVIRVAGGSYSNPGKKIWEGECPLMELNRMVFVDESNENDAKAYYISETSVHANKEGIWQTLFVVPRGPSRE